MRQPATHQRVESDLSFSTNLSNRKSFSNLRTSIQDIAVTKNCTAMTTGFLVVTASKNINPRALRDIPMASQKVVVRFRERSLISSGRSESSTAVWTNHSSY